MFERLKQKKQHKEQWIDPAHWTIDKRFDFCYGHRVWSQQLNPDYCAKDDNTCKCRFMHGHQGHVHVYLKSKELDNGFLTDFKHLGWVDDFIDQYLDHKFIMDLNDPWFVNITNMSYFNDPDTGELLGFQPWMPLNTTRAAALEAKPIYFPGTDYLAGYTINVEPLSGPEREFFEGFFIINFVPTSENLAQWIAKGIDEKMQQINIRVHKVDWIETPKSRATYHITQ